MSQITSIRFVYRTGIHPQMGITKHKLTINASENMIIQSVFPIIGNRISYRYILDSEVMKNLFNYLIHDLNIEELEPATEIDEKQPYYKISLLSDDGSVKVMKGTQVPAFADELMEKLNQSVDFRERIFLF